MIEWHLDQLLYIYHSRLQLDFEFIDQFCLPLSKYLISKIRTVLGLKTPHVNVLNDLGFIVDTLTLDPFCLAILVLDSLLRPSQCMAFYKQRCHDLGFIVDTLTCMYVDWNKRRQMPVNAYSRQMSGLRWTLARSHL